jgi:hypothetical protein
MITMDRPTLYDEALYGEPLALLVRKPELNTDHPIWTLGDWNLVLPMPAVRPAPDVQRMISELRAWTQWSSRQLATVLRTSHTTVLGLEAGRPLVAGHSGDLRRRLTNAHDVVSRVYVLAGEDPTATSHVLATAPAGARSPVDALQSGDAAAAYVSAIDVLRPRPSGLLVGSRPRREGATAPLHG